VEDWPADAEGTYRKMRLNSPACGWFPALQTLYWMVAETNLPYATLFFSSHLEKIYVYMSWSEERCTVPRGILPAIASAISVLHTSALQCLYVGVGVDGAPLEYFKDSLSTVILHCGPSLTEIRSVVRLSDAAANHLIKLPTSVPSTLKVLLQAIPLHLCPSFSHLSWTSSFVKALHMGGFPCSNAWSTAPPQRREQHHCPR